MKRNINKEQFKKRARLLRLILQASFYGCLAASALLLISIPVVLLINLPIDTKSLGLFLSMDGTLRYSLEGMVLEYSSVKPALAAFISVILVTLVVVALALGNLYKILETIEKYSPFEKENVQRLSKVGRILIVGSLISPIARYIMTQEVVDLIQLPGLTVNYSVFNTDMLLGGLLVMILSGVFRYGAYLQKEHDATV